MIGTATWALSEASGPQADGERGIADDRHRDAAGLNRNRITAEGEVIWNPKIDVITSGSRCTELVTQLFDGVLG